MYLSLMKKSLRNIAFAVILSFLTAPGSVVPAYANGPGVCGPENFAGGDGTQQNPYQIFDRNSLSELRDCGAADYHYYMLNNNIELSGLWQEINYFTGSLDGKGHSITGIEIVGTLQYNGLFRNLTTADIFDLELSGSITNFHWSTGLLAGVAVDSSFNNITAATEVTGYAVTGGLIGEAYDSSLNAISVNPLTQDSYISVSDGTVGGVLGIAENTSLNNIYSNIDIRPTTGASYIGGVVGIDRRGSGSLKTQSNLNYHGNIVANHSGSANCGGIAGAGASIIQNSSVLDSTISCESGPLGGVTGFGENSIINTKVEAQLQIQSELGYASGIAGGLVGYWTAGESADYQFNGDSFSGTISSASRAAGLIALLTLDQLNQESTVSFSQTYVRATFENADFASGFVSGLNKDLDTDPSNDPAVTVQDSYVDADYYESSNTKALFNFESVPVEIINFVWKYVSDVENIYADDTFSASIGDMKRSGFWDRLGYDMSETWGISQEINEGLPVLRSLNNGAFSNGCEAKNFPKITFKAHVYKLTKKQIKQVNKFARQIANGECVTVYVYGFTSKHEIKKGKKKLSYQNGLSYKRATAVFNLIQAVFTNRDLHLWHDLLGVGSNNLLNKDKTAKQQAANRRVQFGTTS